MSEATLNGWNTAGYLKIVYSEFLEVRKCGEVAQGTPAEPFGIEFHMRIISTDPHADPELFNEWKQTKLV